MASFGGPGLIGSAQVKNPKARLMTLAEYEDRYSSGQTTKDRSIPVWVVTVEGDWTGTGATPSPGYQAPRYRYGVTVLNAQTGGVEEGGAGLPPINLDEAEGLDPASYPTYPLEVPLSYADGVVSFPVGVLSFYGGPPPHAGFGLNRVVLDFTDPLPEAFPGMTAFGFQTVRLEYEDAGGKVLQLSTFSIGPFDPIAGAEKVSVSGQEGWQRSNPNGPNWVAWTGISPDPRFAGSVTYANYVLRSPDGSIALDVLRQMAESIPSGEQVTPIPTPTPAPTAWPTATPGNWPHPTPTLTPTPTPFPPPTPTATPTPQLGPTPSPTPLPWPTPTFPPSTPALGAIVGLVNIGPLCPVEPCPTPIVNNPYLSRFVVLTPTSGSPIRASLAADGSFRAFVPAGVYSLTLTDCTFMGCGRALPQTVTVEASKTTTVDIQIDTGIR